MAKKSKIPQLSKKQRQFLRGLAHELKPLAMIGQQGLTDNLFQAVDQILTNHELVKVKLQPTSSDDKQQAAEQLAKQCQAVLVQVIGKTIILYRPNPKRPADQRILLP